jgi:hypothetical protein
MKKAVIGIVPTQIQAESIAAQLNSAGFATNDISVLFPDKRGAQDFAHEQSTKAPEGAAAGVSAGGIIGGTLGLLAGIGALAIPGLGPFIAAGPIMGALSGAAAGAAVGGVAGALVGMGIPEYEARLYEGRLRAGNILLAVHVETSAAQSRALDVFRRAGVADAATQSEATVPRGAEPVAPPIR